MNIVAVIPARAGSKGIPNKNLRLINGRPLIYYAISNAMSSKFISKVIVSTDSFEIKTIARRMGANVVWRKPELCDDKTTLDIVVYDAIQGLANINYVVTMQPTSPTLKVSSLDAAISKTINEDLDTVISVINKPHLSWGFDGSKYFPKYKERLNRQFLPPNFLETGAFVISKYSVVKPTSRIGKRISVFELNQEEAIDVDCFEDLVLVKRAFENKKIAIYANGNNEIGLGHVYRALELADEFDTKPDIFYNKHITDCKVFGNTKHNLLPINGIEELIQNCKKNQYSVFINDILSTDKMYIDSLRKAMPNCKIINFEDCGNGAKYADIVFNALLGKSLLKNVKYGEQYYICGKTFLFHEPIKIKKDARKVLITFGGADPMNYTDRILKIISREEYNGILFIVALGKAKKNIDALMKYNKSKNIKVIYDVKNMAELMSEVDVAITSRGRTGYELAILGVPTLSMAQNAREELHDFMSDKNGFIYLGLNPKNEEIKSAFDKLISSSKEERLKLQKNMLSHDLKHGRERVMALIN